MSRYIDADKLIEHMQERYDALYKGCGRYDHYTNGYGEATELVEEFPTADVVEVRHGHWITLEEAELMDRFDLSFTCSVCGHCDWDCTESESFNYCPNCGAKMDIERRSENEG